MNIKEISLQECLRKTGLRELPEPVAEGDYDRYTFLSAIVLTVRMNGTEAYCVAENDGTGLSIKHDFGPCSAIREITAVYPLQRLDRRVVPDLRTDEAIMQYLCKNKFSAEEIAALLSRDGKTDAQIKADRDKIRQYIVKTAVDENNRKKQEESRVAEVKSYKSRISKNGKRKP